MNGRTKQGIRRLCAMALLAGSALAGAYGQQMPADAEFVFLPHDTDWANVHNGTVYDVPDCELGHHGEEVSFDAILRKYGLTDTSLALLAQIVRAADSHPGSPHPAGEGLRWIAHGFSALDLSDHDILEREFIVYDALYAECRKRVAA